MPHKRKNEKYYLYKEIQNVPELQEKTHKPEQS